MPASPLSEARKQIRNTYGKAFEAKASDALVLSLAQPLAFSRDFAPRRGATFAMTAAVRAAAAGAEPAAMAGPSAVVVECSQPAAAREAAIEAGQPGWQELSATLEKLGPGGGDVLSVVRRLRATQLRDGFYRQIAPLREQLGRMAGPVQPEAVAAGVSRPVTQVCWLNATLRTAPHLSALAEVAQDPEVARLGLPRLLAPEARAGDVLGAAAFRKRMGLSGKGVVVAVLDTEIAFKHKLFDGRVVLKENYTREPWGHPDRHGTAVAGLLAASAKSFSGIAPEATIFHYKVLATDARHNADDFGGALAIQQALEDGAHIANCSWGIGPADHGTSREARAFDRAWSLGLAIVKSAGNVGTQGLTSPADAQGVIVVGATEPQGRRVIPESSRGTTPNGRQLDCIAPGGSSSEHLTSCLVNGKVGKVGFGTSYAAPQVAGILALLLEKDRQQTPDALRAALHGLCRKLSRVGADTQGKGLPVL